MAWITPKTDWQSSDAYNADDLNRVEGNLAALRSLLISIGTDVPSIVVNTNRTALDYELVFSVNRVEGNLETIRRAFYTPEGYLPAITWTPTTPFTAADANRWEANTLLLWTITNASIASLRYCGTFAAGEEVLG